MRAGPRPPAHRPTGEDSTARKPVPTIPPSTAPQPRIIDLQSELPTTGTSSAGRACSRTSELDLATVLKLLRRSSRAGPGQRPPSRHASFLPPSHRISAHGPSGVATSARPSWQNGLRIVLIGIICNRSRAIVAQDPTAPASLHSTCQAPPRGPLPVRGRAPPAGRHIGLLTLGPRPCYASPHVGLVACAAPMRHTHKIL